MESIEESKKEEDSSDNEEIHVDPQSVIDLELNKKREQYDQQRRSLSLLDPYE